jgi:predicted dithiol-disulfide oxidoreductase (DUF899 family)
MDTAIAEARSANHAVVSRDRWVAERKALLAHEKELCTVAQGIAPACC